LQDLPTETYGRDFEIYKRTGVRCGKEIQNIFILVVSLDGLIHQTTMNEEGGACSSPAEQMYSLSSFMCQSTLFIFYKKRNKICKIQSGLSSFIQR
jgi:hypothetical protein